MPDAFAKCPLVLIEWVDSYVSTGGWRLIEEEEADDLGCELFRTVGWVLREDKDWIRLAQNIGTGSGESPQCCNLMTIPKRCIISKRPLTAGAKPAR